MRKLVPGVAPGETMEDVVTAPFDYSMLDAPGNLTRIRLNSTVVDLRHRDGALDADVDLTYVNGGNARTVTAGKVVWAGYHFMLPHVCPDVPAEQVDALGASVRAPLVYTNVLIRNWESLAELGVQRVFCPGSFFQTIMFTHAVSYGDYRFSTSPDEPVILHLGHIPLEPGLPAADQFRAGQRKLLATPFETFERNVREQLGRILGPGGFEPARDIQGITVNRWPHGYAYGYNPLFDPDYPPGEAPHEIGRTRFGNIAIANSDAGARAYLDEAINQAHRAVGELLG